MREILFRGKRTDNGEWIEGDYSHDPDLETDYISRYRYYTGREEGLQRELYHYQVIPETVGQYTGLTDKNGEKIFEGDIIENVVIGEKGVVQFFDGHSAFIIWSRTQNVIYFLYNNVFSSICIVGNAYDNPELLGGEHR